MDHYAHGVEAFAADDARLKSANFAARNMPHSQVLQREKEVHGQRVLQNRYSVQEWNDVCRETAAELIERVLATWRRLEKDPANVLLKDRLIELNQRCLLKIVRPHEHEGMWGRSAEMHAAHVRAGTEFESPVHAEKRKFYSNLLQDPSLAETHPPVYTLDHVHELERRRAEITQQTRAIAKALGDVDLWEKLDDERNMLKQMIHTAKVPHEAWRQMLTHRAFEEKLERIKERWMQLLADPTNYRVRHALMTDNDQLLTALVRVGQLGGAPPH